MKSAFLGTIFLALSMLTSAQANEIDVQIDVSATDVDQWNIALAGADDKVVIDQLNGAGIIDLVANEADDVVLNNKVDQALQVNGVFGYVEKKGGVVKETQTNLAGIISAVLNTVGNDATVKAKTVTSNVTQVNVGLAGLGARDVISQTNINALVSLDVNVTP